MLKHKLSQKIRSTGPDRVRTWTGPPVRSTCGPSKSSPGPPVTLRSWTGPVLGPAEKPWSGPGPDHDNPTAKAEETQPTQLKLETPDVIMQDA